MKDFPEIDTLLRTYDAWNLVPDQETYNYMIRLRHHGFPSPLLDWTRSYHIAAFFAFRSCGTDDAGQVSLYALSVQPRGMHGRRLAEAAIRSMGSLITTHRRHFLQRSEYAICGVFDSEQKWRFAEHERVFTRSDSFQDVLWRFTIPKSQRAAVLRLFDSFNLNAFSLFGSEESLMETLAARELDLREEAP